MKVEYKLPKGYRWAKVGEQLLRSDKTYRSGKWYLLKDNMGGEDLALFDCEEPRTFIRKIKRKKP